MKLDLKDQFDELAPKSQAEIKVPRPHDPSQAEQYIGIGNYGKVRARGGRHTHAHLRPGVRPAPCSQELPSGQWAVEPPSVRGKRFLCLLVPACRSSPRWRARTRRKCARTGSTGACTAGSWCRCASVGRGRAGALLVGTAALD